jgi:hypothetical protein
MKTAVERYDEAEAQIGHAESLRRPLMIAAIEAAVAEERARCAAIADDYAAQAKEDRSIWAAECIAATIRGGLTQPLSDHDRRR